MRLLNIFLIASALACVYAADKELSLPVVLPPYQDSDLSNAANDWNSCLLYMEAITITVFPGKDAKPRGASATISSANATKPHQYVWNEDYARCLKNVTKSTNDNNNGNGNNKNVAEPQNFSFTIDLKLAEQVKAVKADEKDKEYFSVDGSLKFILTFNMTRDGYWELAKVDTDGFSVEKGNQDGWLNEKLTVESSNATARTVKDMRISASLIESWACSRSRVAVFKTNNEKYEIGVNFENVQIQPFDAVSGGNKTARFSPRVSDCTGTFTVGSWMGIIVTLVLASIFMFGYLMLNSVQTIDRFDDPKSKQLLINAKE